jgi:hypothetical protein
MNRLFLLLISLSLVLQFLIKSTTPRDFGECYSNREVIEIDGIMINFISLSDLKKNKQAAGRHKDMEDLEHLP